MPGQAGQRQRPARERQLQGRRQGARAGGALRRADGRDRARRHARARGHCRTRRALARLGRAAQGACPPVVAHAAPRPGQVCSKGAPRRARRPRGAADGPWRRRAPGRLAPRRPRPPGLPLHGQGPHRLLRRPRKLQGGWAPRLCPRRGRLGRPAALRREMGPLRHGAGRHGHPHREPRRPVHRRLRLPVRRDGPRVRRVQDGPDAPARRRRRRLRPRPARGRAGGQEPLGPGRVCRRDVSAAGRHHHGQRGGAPAAQLGPLHHRGGALHVAVQGPAVRHPRHGAPVAAPRPARLAGRHGQHPGRRRPRLARRACRPGPDRVRGRHRHTPAPLRQGAQARPQDRPHHLHNAVAGRRPAPDHGPLPQPGRRDAPAAPRRLRRAAAARGAPARGARRARRGPQLARRPAAPRRGDHGLRLGPVGAGARPRRAGALRRALRLHHHVGAPHPGPHGRAGPRRRGARRQGAHRRRRRRRPPAGHAGVGDDAARHRRARQGHPPRRQRQPAEHSADAQGHPRGHGRHQQLDQRRPAGRAHPRRPPPRVPRPPGRARGRHARRGRGQGRPPRARGLPRLPGPGGGQRGVADVAPRAGDAADRSPGDPRLLRTVLLFPGSRRAPRPLLSPPPPV